MNIFITCPNPRNPHGGLRVIFEWAKYLSYHHKVYLYFLDGAVPKWYSLSDRINVCDFSKFMECDCVIFTSPHSADMLDLVLPKQKCFLFLQMAEDMFYPTDRNWFRLCKKFYQANYKMFCISKWLIDYLNDNFHRSNFNFTYYLNNGIDKISFPIIRNSKLKDDKTILIEGFEPGNNPTKDSERISVSISKKLMQKGYRVLAYSQHKSLAGKSISEYYIQPSLDKLNELYERSTLLIKASKYDARSTSPIEAMTKGTVTIRGIIKGDDDLVHNVNCLRVEYNEQQIMQSIEQFYSSNELRSKLVQGVYDHVIQNCDWPEILSKVNDIMTG